MLGEITSSYRTECEKPDRVTSAGSDKDLSLPEFKPLTELNVEELRKRLALGLDPNVLLESGAVVDATDSKGNTALHAAALFGIEASMILLIRAGADVNAMNRYKERPLHGAAALGWPKPVQILLDAGACIHAVNNRRETALHVAVSSGHQCILTVKELIRRGIGVNERDIRGICRDVDRTASPLPPSLQQEVEEVVPRLGLRLLRLMMCGRYVRRRSKMEESVRHLTRFGARLTHLDSTLALAARFPGLTARLLDRTMRETKPSGGEKVIEFDLFQFRGIGKTRDWDHGNCDALKPNDPKLKPMTDVLLITLIALTVVIGFRELIQMMAQKWEYFKDLENVIEVVLLVLDMLMVFSKFDIRYFDRDLDDHISAVVVFLVWVEVTILVGKLPGQGLYITMLINVSRSFLRVVPTFIFLLAGFGLSFHILFPGKFVDVPSSIYRAAVMMSGELEFYATFYESNRVLRWSGHIIYLLFVALMAIIVMNLLTSLAFVDVPSSIYRAAVMMSGELEFYATFYESNRVLRWSGHIIYLLFVALMAIIVMNLLTSLAVADVQELTKRAEITRLQKQVRLLYHLENVIKNKYFLRRRREPDLIETGRLQEKKRELPNHILENILRVISEVSAEDKKVKEEVKHLENDKEGSSPEGIMNVEESITSIQKQIQQVSSQIQRIQEEQIPELLKLLRDREKSS
ncbi:unnamed protein product [Darwinula stevensoni]|uniref:Ion transport domain-containing protein n=1 Tax=Darwinula stevensoni TaxID=69355 RepID=A0A7R9AAB1_9CRUS|nr:unnamed protein product [Darwinula stevensoni]CAG0897916.1 unnamed protein product [Darwinula stevensoni]